jgi:methionyl-tRNA formyltransferase
MKIAVLTPSDANPYACALWQRLLHDGCSPAGVICAAESNWRRFSNYLVVHGWRQTLRRSLTETHVSKRQPAVVQLLHQHLQEKGINNWRTPLSQEVRVAHASYLAVRSANQPQAVDWIREQQIDLVLNTGGEVLRSSFIASPRVGVLNAHMGPLPQVRGMNALEWSVLQDLSPAVTLHTINEEIDSGDILLQRKVSLQPDDNLETARARSIVVAVEAMIEAVTLIRSGQARPEPQPETDHKQYFAMHPRIKAVVEKKLHAANRRALQHG